MGKYGPWTKWYPDDFLNGVLFKLHIEAVGVYAVLLNMIYSEGGPVRDDIKRLSRVMGMRPSSLEKRLAELVREGKIIRTDGVISNARAEIEIENRVQKLKETRPKVDKKSTKTRENLSKKSNDFNKKLRPDIDTDTEVDIDKKIIRAPAELKRTHAPKQRATRIDPHRKITEGNITFGIDRGLTKKEIDFEWQRFVRYYAARDDKYPNARSMDWDATWENWVLGKAHELNREPLTSARETPPRPEALGRDVWMRSVEIYRATGQWHPDMGPPPDKPGYLGPPDLVRPS